jgi:hypothetical protein
MASFLAKVETIKASSLVLGKFAIFPLSKRHKRMQYFQVVFHFYRFHKVTRYQLVVGRQVLSSPETKKKSSQTNCKSPLKLEILYFQNYLRFPIRFVAVWPYHSMATLRILAAESYLKLPIP